MSSELLAVVALMLIGFAALGWYLKQLSEKVGQPQGDIEKVVNEVFGLTTQKIAEQSKSILSSEREVIKTDLDNKQRVIEKLVGQLQEDLKTRQSEIRLLEQDRTKKFGELSTALEEQRKITTQLQTTTEQLSRVLSNNQVRGQWGERIIEDLLKANGLQEGVHYLKQKSQTETGRPDITLLLPDQRTVPVDVKFPYQAVQRYTDATDKTGRDMALKQFAQDVKIKITKVATYISPADHTMDYAILFVPNELLFSFINQKFPDLMDEAVAKRVLMVSPFTFVIVAATMKESYRNFMLSDQLRDVMSAIDDFGNEWGKFKDKFTKYGRSIETLKSDYEDITGTRFRQLDKRVNRVQQLQAGEQNSLLESELE